VHAEYQNPGVQIVQTNAAYQMEALRWLSAQRKIDYGHVWLMLKESLITGFDVKSGNDLFDPNWLQHQATRLRKNRMIVDYQNANQDPSPARWRDCFIRRRRPSGKIAQFSSGNFPE
jgi:hypothetical protein